jgi:ankyrin repeat protein
MGAAASADALSPPPYGTPAEALAAGHTQADVDAYVLAAQRGVGGGADMEEEEEEEEEELGDGERESMARLLSGSDDMASSSTSSTAYSSSPPDAVMRWINEDGDLAARASDESEHRRALTWTQDMLLLAHKHASIKACVKRLLAVFDFTANMDVMDIFEPLKEFCSKRLLDIGRPLQDYYRGNEDVRSLAALVPAHLPELALTKGSHLRQDHIAVNLGAASASIDPSTPDGESVYIHFLRLVALLVNDKYQGMVQRVVTPLGGEHKRCAIKGDVRMRNKMLAPDDHRYAQKPRPALNIDIVRCCVTFDDVASMRKGIEALLTAVSQGGGGAGGVGRVKNGFATNEDDAAKSFHYRSFMLNLLVDFGCTFGELCNTLEAAAILDKYVNAPPENPEEPWGKWRRDALAAVTSVKREAMSSQPAMMVCEVQVLLRPYLEARKEMHLLYKVVRAASAGHLAQQFAVSKAGTDGRPKNATWTSEERRAVDETTLDVANGEPLALLWACKGGFVKAVNVALSSGEVDVNRSDPDDGCTPLWVACQNGHLDVVQALLFADEIHINQADNDGVTPLYEACQRGHVGVVRALVDASGIQVNRAKNGFVTPLFMACQFGYLEVVCALLGAKGIEANRANDNGASPLLMACRNGHLDVVQALLLDTNVVDVNFAQASTGCTPLFQACQNGYFEVVTALLDVDGIEVNRANDDGITPLNIASDNGHLEVVMAMLAGAAGTIQVNQPEVLGGGTPLFQACQNGHLEVIRALLGADGIKINQKNKDGATPLFQACGEGHLDVVRVLLAVDGIKVNEVDNEGASPLFMACGEGHAEVVRVLLGAEGIEINQARPNDGATPLMMACGEGHVDVVRALLGADGIETNTADSDGSTPLYMACGEGYVEVVRALLCTDGIYVNVRLTDGQSPLTAAAEADSPGVIKLLLGAGADVNARVIDPSPLDPSCSGLTALGVARANGCRKAEVALMEAGAEV